MADYLLWNWWNTLTPDEQEAILRTVYKMQEENVWIEVNKDGLEDL
jgi:TRAP-type C4-dicarboxylate transport system substrate-binding protein